MPADRWGPYQRHPQHGPEVMGRQRPVRFHQRRGPRRGDAWGTASPGPSVSWPRVDRVMTTTTTPRGNQSLRVARNTRNGCPAPVDLSRLAIRSAQYAARCHSACGAVSTIQPFATARSMAVRSNPSSGTIRCRAAPPCGKPRQQTAQQRRVSAARAGDRRGCRPHPTAPATHRPAGAQPRFPTVRQQPGPQPSGEAQSGQHERPAPPAGTGASRPPRPGDSATDRSRGRPGDSRPGPRPSATWPDIGNTHSPAAARPDSQYRPPTRLAEEHVIGGRAPPAYSATPESANRRRTSRSCPASPGAPTTTANGRAPDRGAAAKLPRASSNGRDPGTATASRSGLPRESRGPAPIRRKPAAGEVRPDQFGQPPGPEAEVVDVFVMRAGVGLAEQPAGPPNAVRGPGRAAGTAGIFVQAPRRRYAARSLCRSHSVAGSICTAANSRAVTAAAASRRNGAPSAEEAAEDGSPTRTGGRGPPIREWGFAARREPRPRRPAAP